jgi:hypothetical protein
MTFQIAKSVINGLPYSYADAVETFRQAKLAHRFTGDVAPSAPAIIEHAVRRVPRDGQADDFVAGRGRYPRPPAMDGTWPLCDRLVFAAPLFGFLGLLMRLRQPVKRALDAGDQAGCDARVARRRAQFVVTQQCLDDSDISVVFEQVGREAVPPMSLTT